MLEEDLITIKKVLMENNKDLEKIEEFLMKDIDNDNILKMIDDILIKNEVIIKIIDDII